MSTALSYDDVLLVPQYSEIHSRSEIDISVDLGNGLTLAVPIISSPMDTISEHAMAIAMNTAGCAAVIHRYNTRAEQEEEVALARLIDKGGNIGVAVGVTNDYVERCAFARSCGANFVCIDVAHGHHILVKEAIQNLREAMGPNFHIMAGNVATLKGINDLADWGADSVRCNIGGGSICSTRIQTGHGLPGFQTIVECAKTDRDIKIIADGGIKNSGDIVKALAAGADAVMVGSLLAGTSETPGEIFKDPSGFEWKTYRGMASKEAQINWKGKYSSLEGVSARVPVKGPASNILADLERGIRSGFSYSGARSLQELHAKAQFVIQTPSGTIESRTHILNKR